MEIRTVSFNPIRVNVDGKEVETIKLSYDKDGESFDVICVVLDGEKISIKHDTRLMHEELNSNILNIKKVEKFNTGSPHEVIELTKEQYDQAWANVKETKV